MSRTIKKPVVRPRRGRFLGEYGEEPDYQMTQEEYEEQNRMFGEVE